VRVVEIVRRVSRTAIGAVHPSLFVLPGSVSLRITGGVLKGREVPEAVGAGIRPTSSRVREALFDLVGHDLGGTTVLDAFGGSGLVAIEAWSRGAEVTVTERSPRAARAIARRAEALGAEIAVRVADAERLAPELGEFDGIFVDPPYAADPGPAVRALAPRARSWLVLEVEGDRPPPDAPPLRVDRVRRYGRTSLVVYRSDSSGLAPDTSQRE
jgi:16S rRNA (guanine(966)-N(2))-methyltransferase RsmD